MAKLFRAQIVGQEKVRRSPGLGCLPSSGASVEDFAQVGIRLGPVYDDDPIFRRASIPDGWSIESTSDPSISFLKDPRGCRRAEILYINTEAQRKARVTLRRRFGYRTEQRDGKFCGLVTDAGEVSYRSKPQRTRVAAEQMALDFLKKNYSGWEHYNAYWERA